MSAIGADQAHHATGEAFAAQFGVAAALLVGPADAPLQRPGAGAHRLEAGQPPLLGIVQQGGKTVSIEPTSVHTRAPIRFSPATEPPTW